VPKFRYTIDVTLSADNDGVITDAFTAFKDAIDADPGLEAAHNITLKDNSGNQMVPAHGDGDI
jgi:hypothetical protein